MINRRTFVATILMTSVHALRSNGAAARPKATTGPKTVLLIRHAEETKGPHLNGDGRARAEALPGLFPTRFAKPTALYAAKSTANSLRCLETIEPLAKALQIRVDHSFVDAKFNALAKSILSNDGVVLVCWKHDGLPALAAALGVKQPPAWPSKQYDHIWQITYSPDGSAALKDISQRLLPGDK